MQKTYLLLFLLMLLSLSIQAQKITGTVTDKETGEPLGTGILSGSEKFRYSYPNGRKIQHSLSEREDIVFFHDGI